MIELPEEVNLSEFIAYKTYMFYGCVNSLKSILDKYCTSALCPKLINNNIQNYHPKLKKSRLDALSAINTILRKTEEDITDEQIFPTDISNYFTR
ncbi:MAG: Maintenance of ploidy protein mob2 [Marteilia pararefringens]